MKNYTENSPPEIFRQKKKKAIFNNDALDSIESIFDLQH